MKERAADQVRQYRGADYIVAPSCPHAKPEGAPFYACAMQTVARVEEHKPVRISVYCEFTDAGGITKNFEGDSYTVCCRHGDHGGGRQAEFGTPTVRNAS